MGTNISKAKRESLISKISVIKENIIKVSDESIRQELVSYLSEIEKEIKK